MSQLRCLWAPLPGSLKGAEGGEKKTVREQHRGTGDSRAHSPSSWGHEKNKGARRQQARLRPASPLVRVGPPMSKTAVALVCSCLWVAPCMGAATPWVLLPLGVLLPLRAPSLGAPTPWLLLSHRVLLPPAFRVRAR